MDIEIGKGMVNAGKDYVHKGFENVNFHTFHPYFTITNTSILKKLLLILFPFKTRNWTSSQTNPDLYIPLMSFLTYILVSAVLSLEHKFTPDKLSLLFTKLVTYEMILGGVVKVVGYFMDINELGFIDFVCYSGYKFVTVLCLVVVRIKYIQVLWRVYLFVSFFFFLSRSLKGRMSMQRRRRRKIYFLFMVVILEMGLVYLLARKY